MTGALAACQGRAPALVSIANHTINSTGTGTRTATYTISSDGTTKNQSGTVLETWRNGGPASAYEVRATVTDDATGALTGSATGTWLSLSSDRSWSVADSTQFDGAVAATLTIEISFAGVATALDSAGIGLFAERT